MKQIVLIIFVLISAYASGQGYFDIHETFGANTTRRQLVALDVPSNFLRSNATNTSSGNTVIDKNGFTFSINGSGTLNLTTGSNTYSVSNFGHFFNTKQLGLAGDLFTSGGHALTFTTTGTTGLTLPTSGTLATTSQVALKQDLLTNGNGTTISGNQVNIGGAMPTGSHVLTGAAGTANLDFGSFGNYFGTIRAFTANRFTVESTLGGQILDFNGSTTALTTGNNFALNIGGSLGTSGDVLTSNGTTATWSPPASGSWGSITGTLSDQTDLQAALDLKVGFGSYAVGDILAANTTTTVSKINAGSAGSFLRSVATSTLPVWSTLILPNAATANQIVYATATNTWGGSANFIYDGTRFAVNATATNNNAVGITMPVTLTGSGNAMLKIGGAGSTTTLRATPSDMFYKIASDGTIVTGATNQSIRWNQEIGTYTFNHAGGGLDGIYFNPLINGTQAASAAIRAATFVSGTMVMGATATTAGALMDLQSTSLGFAQPRMTTTQRDAIASPFDGLSVHNTTTHSHNYYNGTNWVDPGLEVKSIVSSPTNYTTTATYQNVTSISLVAGDWDVSAMLTLVANSATLTVNNPAIFAVSTTTGATDAHTVQGVNIFYVSSSTAGTGALSGSIPAYRVTLGSTTTLYLVTQATFTSGTPQFVGNIRAIRIK